MMHSLTTELGDDRLVLISRPAQQPKSEMLADLHPHDLGSVFLFTTFVSSKHLFQFVHIPVCPDEAIRTKER